MTRMGQIDADGCAKEPIHLSGAIQAHGYLVSCAMPDWTVRQVSSNIEALLDVPVDGLLGHSLREYVSEDVLQAILDTLPLAVGVLVTLTMLVLWLMTGSVVLPVKAVLMNLLTVGVSLGAITFIYQAGRFTDLLGYTSNGGVDLSNFLIAAAVVFAVLVLAWARVAAQTLHGAVVRGYLLAPPVA